MKKARQNIKQKYISSAFILMVSTVVVKIISAVYKIPLTAYIGAAGRGCFSVAYNLCMPIHALTMGAFPIALSKLVSTYNAKGDYLKIKAVKKASGRLFFIVGTAGMMIMILAAEPYAKGVASSPKSLYTILALAPSVLFSCLAASKRAFAEGYLDMKPTALSQVIEALFKMVFGLLFARFSMSYLYDSYCKSGAVLGIPAAGEEDALSQIYPLTAACAMLGVTLASIASWIFSAVYTNSRYNSFPAGKIDVREGMNELVMFSLPLVGATAVQSIANFIDTASIQYSLTLVDKAALSLQYNISGDDVYTYLYGIYSAALDFKNLVPGIVMSLGVTAVPAVSAAYESSTERFTALMNSILKYTSVLACAGGGVLSLFSGDILSLFYGSSNSDIAENGSSLLFLFGVTMLPCCIASTAVYCVQSLGYSKQIILPFLVSAVVRCTLNLLLVSRAEINILASAVSNFAGFLIIAVWSILILKKKINCRVSILNVFVKPIICTSVVYFAVKIIREAVFTGLSDFWSFALSLLIYGVILAFLLILLKIISLSELKTNK
ncbi:MAG: oligosaccharide flippase family protein [Eubacteriales bacterium]|nr:oligosaccharide flippase family protein [Eubacteriales bacterium]